MTVAVVEGYFFSHDPRPFPGEMVVAKYINEGDGLKDFDASKVTFEDTENQGGTPKDAYRESQTDFTYKLNAFYNGQPLYYSNGERVVVTAYIGVKGDSNLDNKVDSLDATNALRYFGSMQTGSKPDETRITPPSCQIVTDHPELELLSALLIDVELDCYSKGNWNMPKADRKIDSSDCSFILVYFANVQTGLKDSTENWNKTLGKDKNGKTRGEKFEDYVANGTLY